MCVVVQTQMGNGYLRCCSSRLRMRIMHSALGFIVTSFDMKVMNILNPSVIVTSHLCKMCEIAYFSVDFYFTHLLVFVVF